MNITKWEYEQFEACREQGFISLEWEEEYCPITEQDRHRACIEGNGFLISAVIVHIKQGQKSARESFEIVVYFSCKSDLGELKCQTTFPHKEFDLKSALDYGRWQVTLVDKLIKGKILS